MSSEGMNRIPRPVERELKSQAHRETPEEAEQKEIIEALKRTLSEDAWDAFSSAIAPGIPLQERTERIAHFNLLEAGTPDEGEAIEGREHTQVPINFAGTNLLVSRTPRGIFSIEFPGS